MKILFYFGGFAPTGGIETFCKNLLSYLQGNNFKCTLICWGKDSPLIELIQQAKVNIVRIPWRWGCQWNLPDWFLLPFSYHNLERADVIVFGKLLPLKILQRLRKKAKIRTKFVYITPYKPLPSKSLQEKQYKQESLKIFDTIIVQASSFIKELKNLNYQGKVEVIPYITPQSETITPFPSNEELKIGFLGRLVEDKNVSLLIHSFDLLAKKYTDKKISLHIFGDGHLRCKLEQLTKDLGIDKLVIFHGNIPQSQVSASIASCHLFGFTSHVEGQCLAALEILSCGRPIVATEAGAFPDILDDSRLGRLVVNANPENIALGIEELIKKIKQNHISPEIVKATYLKRYSPELVGNTYYKLFNSLGQK